MDQSLLKAIYGLISAIFVNIIVGIGKSIYGEHILFKQAAAEVGSVFSLLKKMRTGYQEKEMVFFP